MDPISAGIAAVGALFSGISGFFSGRAQARQYQAEALQQREEAGVASSQALAQGDEVAARAATQAAANGGGFDGSSMAVIASLGQQSLFNARAAVYRGETAARQDLYDAKVAKIGAVTSLISTVAPVAGDIRKGQLGVQAQKARYPQVPTSNTTSFLSAGAGDTDMNLGAA